MKDMPVHYRYDDHMLEGGVEVRVSEFYPIRETPCFYMVVSEWQKFALSVQPNRKVKPKRVSKNSLRRYCYPTKAEALKSYKKRKLAQIGHAELALAKANQALAAINENTQEFDTLDCGRPDYWDCLNFD